MDVIMTWIQKEMERKYKGNIMERNFSFDDAKILYIAIKDFRQG